MADIENVTPKKREYKTIKPLQIFQKGYFPFIENTFEALDWYGLICKVVDYLNQVISNENTSQDNIQSLYDAFTTLQTNLQTALDSTDSELRDLISERETYLQGQISENHDNIQDNILSISNIENIIENSVPLYRGSIEELEYTSLDQAHKKGYYSYLFETIENFADIPESITSDGFLIVLDGLIRDEIEQDTFQFLVEKRGKIYFRYRYLGTGQVWLWTSWKDLSVPEDLNTNYLKYRGNLADLGITDLNEPQDAGFYSLRLTSSTIANYSNLPIRNSSLIPMDYQISATTSYYILVVIPSFLGNRPIRFFFKLGDTSICYVKTQTSDDWQLVSYRGVRKSSLQGYVASLQESISFAMANVTAVGSFTISRSNFGYVTDLPAEIVNDTDISSIELDTKDQFKKIYTDTGEAWQLISGTWTKIYPLASGAQLNIVASLAEPEIKKGLWLKGNVDIENIEEIKSISSAPYWNTEKMNTLQSMPQQNGFYNGAVLLLNNLFYILGGTNSGTSLYSYNPLTDSYRQLANIPYNFYAGCAVGVGNNIYIFGGSNNANSMAIYDIENDTWSNISRIPSNNFTYTACCFVESSNKILFFRWFCFN